MKEGSAISTYPPAQIADAAYRAGFRGQALTVAVAVALAESHGNPSSHNAVPPDNSYGLWQINMIDSLGPARRAQFHIHTNDALFIPSVNARAAWAISAHGTNWKPWSTYQNGAYTGFLDQARPAARRAMDTHGHAGPAPRWRPGPRGHRIVLDLAELHSLTRLFERASDDVRETRRAVQRLTDSIEPARLALPDRALGNAISATLALIADRQVGLDRVAERLDRQARYTAEVRRLAEQADSNRDGRWSRTEARTLTARFHHHPTPAQRAVTEALAAGGIHRHLDRTGGVSARSRRINRMLALASTQYAREHNGDNRTKYGDWYGHNGAPWCAQFVSWVFWHSHNRLPAIDSAKGFQSVPDAIRYARAHNELHRRPRPGDVFLCRDGGHTGIVTKVYRDGQFDTVEGNWGNQVSREHRDARDGSYYFWSPIH